MQCLMAIHRHLWKEFSSASTGIVLPKQHHKRSLHCLAIQQGTHGGGQQISLKCLLPSSFTWLLDNTLLKHQC